MGGGRLGGRERWGKGGWASGKSFMSELEKHILCQAPLEHWSQFDQVRFEESPCLLGMKFPALSTAIQYKFTQTSRTISNNGIINNP